jgi:UDP-glucose 4-epimerase
MLNARNVFIAGGAGFIGLNLCDVLRENDFSITVLDSHLDSSRIPKQLENAGEIQWIEGDVRQAEKYMSVIKECPHIIHLAANTQVIESINNPEEFVKYNVNCLMPLLETARKSGVRSFIFASSNSAVGESVTKISEMNLPKPISPYGASKLFGESICHSYTHSYGMPTTSLRFSNAYGPYSRHKTSVIANYFHRLECGESLVVYGDGNQTRDFIHARDIGSAIQAVLVKDGNNRSPLFQVATGVETSINELIHCIQEVTNTDLSFSNAAHRDGEIRKNVSDIGLIKNELDWKPGIPLKEGLKNTWTWWARSKR